MSMCGRFVAVSDQQIDAFLAEPETVEAFLDPEDESALVAQRAVDVDKAWHAIHYLLAGQAWEGSLPLGFVVKGGQEIGEVDMGYGPARALRASEVRALAAALAPIDRATLMSRWDADAMEAESIYGIDPRDPAREDRYVGVYYDDLKTFVTALANDGLGMLVYIY